MRGQSAVGVATYLRLVGKFHTRTCTCAGSIDKNQAKTFAFVSVAMFLFRDFFAYPPMTGFKQTWKA